MSMIKEKTNSTNVTRYYCIDQFKSDNSAIKWLNDVRYANGIIIDYIYYSDLMNRSDEGSGNIQFDADTDLDVLTRELRNREVDIVLLNGTYNGSPIVVGLDLRKKLVFLTVRKRNPADIEMFEKVFGLTNIIDC